MGFYLLDHFTGADGAAWNATNWPVIRDGRTTGPSTMPTINANQGRMAVDAGDHRLLAFGAPVLADFDIRVTYHPITTPPNVASEVGYRVSDNIAGPGAPDHGYVMAILPFATSVRCYKIASGDTVIERHDVLINDNLARYFRIRVKGDRHQYKWWLTTDTEPPGWGLDFTDSTYTSGHFMLASWITETEGASIVDWDDFRVEEITPADPGIRVGPFTLDALYVGDQPVAAAYYGTTPIPVP